MLVSIMRLSSTVLGRYVGLDKLQDLHVKAMHCQTFFFFLNPRGRLLVLDRNLVSYLHRYATQGKARIEHPQ